MKLISAADVSGEMFDINGELDAEFVHKYDTVYGPALDDKDIEEQFKQVKGVNNVSVREISGGMARYEVEVFLDYQEAIHDDTYQEIMDQTL